MDVIPTISTPREDARTVSSSKNAFRTMPYELYLQTPHWRKVRNRALRRAGWACMRCPSTVNLEVHHRTYERLGEERDGDLEVVCQACHRNHHIDEEHEIRTRYVAVVSACLEAERFTCMADLLEAVKVTCARAKIPYDGPKIWRAVKLVDANRHGVIDAPKARPHIVPPPALLEKPIGQSEAASLLALVKFKVELHEMPRPSGRTTRDLFRERAMEQVCALMLESFKRCEQLEADVAREQK